MFVKAFALFNALNATQTSAASKAEAARIDALYGGFLSFRPSSAHDLQGLAKDEEVISQAPPGPGDKRKESSDNNEDLEAALQFLDREAAEKAPATEIPMQSFEAGEVVAMRKRFVSLSRVDQHRIVSLSPHFNMSLPTTAAEPAVDTRVPGGGSGTPSGSLVTPSNPPQKSSQAIEPLFVSGDALREQGNESVEPQAPAAVLTSVDQGVSAQNQNRITEPETRPEGNMAISMAELDRHAACIAPRRNPGVEWQKQNSIKEPETRPEGHMAQPRAELEVEAATQPPAGCTPTQSI